MTNLVIVESPTKAKTIAKFLGQGFKVESSFGHVRDLPTSKLGVDTDNNYEPTYVVPLRSKSHVKEIQQAAGKANEVYFATDEDREGEAIAWHLAQLLKKPIPETKRITFHEITKEAIEHSLENPRHIDINLVDAQQARRILDRLVGYKLSPFLWKKVARGLSAGRVQSVVVKLIVEREREIKNFKIDEYWEIAGEFSAAKQSEIFIGKLQQISKEKLDKLAIKNQAQAEKIVAELNKKKYYLAAIEKKQLNRNPLPPFTTSSLQQEANRRLGFSAKQTMMLAQQLYEGVEIDGESIGLITYMRTDSVNLAEKFTLAAGQYIENSFGKKYLSLKKFHTKSKGAQEAHEAVRPTEATRTPELVTKFLNRNQARLYQLIWQRAIASQMSAAQIDATALTVNTTNDEYSFRATGQIVRFDGFLKIYPAATKEEILPDIKQGDNIDCHKIIPQQKFTQPPARYSDATLVKTLEEKGIGRPSTYAPTIATVIERGYAERDEHKRLKPQDIAFVVNDLLVEHFPDIVDYEFTAKMENNLDDIAAGKDKWQNTIDDFYQPFQKNIMKKEKELNKKEITEEKTDEKCDKCGSPMIIKIGRYGKFLACSKYPQCKNTKHLDANGAAVTNAPQLLDEKCPECGSPLALRRGRYGEFKGCSNYPQCKFIKKEAAADLNLSCPKCQTGKIVGKRSRRGMFYGCDQYPKCDFAFWGKPNGEKCQNCHYPLVEDKNGKIKCSNKECEH